MDSFSSYLNPDSFSQVSQEPARLDSNRAEISIICEVRQGIRPWARVRLDNLSPTGFRIAWSPSISDRDLLKIRIPGLELLSAKVRWKSEKAIGCSFESPLYDAVFAHIVRQADRF